MGKGERDWGGWCLCNVLYKMDVVIEWKVHSLPDVLF